MKHEFPINSHYNNQTEPHKFYRGFINWYWYANEMKFLVIAENGCKCYFNRIRMAKDFAIENLQSEIQLTLF